MPKEENLIFLNFKGFQKLENFSCDDFFCSFTKKCYINELWRYFLLWSASTTHEPDAREELRQLHAQCGLLDAGLKILQSFLQHGSAFTACGLLF